MQRVLAIGLTAASLVWLAALLSAPAALTHTDAPLAAAAAIVYDIGSKICHQRPERSFHLSGVQLPVCARCLGLYASGAAGAVACFLVPMARRRSRPGGSGSEVRVVLALAALPTALTVGLEFLSLAHPSNVTRAVSALPLGAAAGWVFVRALRSETDHVRARSVRAGA